MNIKVYFKYLFYNLVNLSLKLPLVHVWERAGVRAGRRFSIFWLLAFIALLAWVFALFLSDA
jgi:hypothetical protein